MAYCGWNILEENFPHTYIYINKISCDWQCLIIIIIIINIMLLMLMIIMMMWVFFFPSSSSWNTLFSMFQISIHAFQLNFKNILCTYFASPLGRYWWRTGHRNFPFFLHIPRLITHIHMCTMENVSNLWKMLAMVTRTPTTQLPWMESRKGKFYVPFDKNRKQVTTVNHDFRIL